MLVAGVGTGAAAAAATLASALPAAAGGSVPITIGDQFTNATSVTSLTNTANNANVFRAVSQGSGDALVGQSATGNGVRGQSNSTSDAGVFGLNTSNTGFALGVWGATHAPTGRGVHGSAWGGTGVFGISAVNDPGPRPKVGVFGFSDDGATAQGVRGESPTGRGVVAAGSRAQLRLVPSSRASHPTTGALGDFFLDKNSRLWFCKGGTNWKQIA
jgi:hypothetical protein